MSEDATSEKTIQISEEEYQRLLASDDHSEKLRKKAVEVSKLRAKYDKAKDASLKAKKALDESLREYQELGEEIDDPQQRLPFVDDSKDPQKRKPPERRPQDHVDDDTPEDSAETENSPEAEAEEVAETDAEEYEDVDGGEDADTVEFWRAKDIATLKQSAAKTKNLRAAGINNLGNAWDLINGEIEGLEQGVIKVSGFGEKAVAKFEEALRAKIIELGGKIEEPSAEDEDQGVDDDGSAEVDEDTAPPELPKVKIRVLVDNIAGVEQGAIIDAYQKNSQIVVIRNSDGEQRTLLAPQYDLIA